MFELSSAGVDIKEIDHGRWFVSEVIPGFQYKVRGEFYGPYEAEFRQYSVATTKQLRDRGLEEPDDKMLDERLSMRRQLMGRHLLVEWKTETGPCDDKGKPLARTEELAILLLDGREYRNTIGAEIERNIGLVGKREVQFRDGVVKNSQST